MVDKMLKKDTEDKAHKEKKEEAIEQQAGLVNDGNELRNLDLLRNKNVSEEENDERNDERKESRKCNL